MRRTLSLPSDLEPSTSPPPDEPVAGSNIPTGDSISRSEKAPEMEAAENGNDFKGAHEINGKKIDGKKLELRLKSAMPKTLEGIKQKHEDSSKFTFSCGLI